MHITGITVLATILLGQAGGARVRRQSWALVAHALGGSGKSSDGRYVVLLAADGWGRGVTPQAWVELTASHRGAHVRGTVPARGKQAATVLKALETVMPGPFHPLSRTEKNR